MLLYEIPADQNIHGRLVLNLHEPRALRQERHCKDTVKTEACGMDAQVFLHGH